MLQLFFLQLKLLHFLEYFVRLDFFLLNMYFKIFSAAFLLNYRGSLENLTQKCLNSFSLIVEVCSEKCLCLTGSSEPFHTRTRLGFLGLNPTRQGSHGKIFLFLFFFSGWECLQDSQPVTALQGFLWPGSHTVWLSLLTFSFLLFFLIWFVCLFPCFIPEGTL